MKKIISLFACIALLLTNLLVIEIVQAETDGFTASANVTVTGVTMGSGTVDMLIFNGSMADSWDFSSGVFTVTNPTSFYVGSSNSTVKRITAKKSGARVLCEINTTAGTTQIKIPSESGTYTIEAHDNTECGTTSGSSGGGGGGGGSSPAPAASTPTTTPTTPSTPTTPTTSTPTTTPTTQTPIPTSSISEDTNLSNVLSDALTILKGDKEAIAIGSGKSVDVAKESEYESSIVSKIVLKTDSASSETKGKITAFVTYGTPTTESLGAGERGGVVNSFKAALGRLPASEADWQDVVKIANGRWPAQTSKDREAIAEGNFKAIYLRKPNRSNPNDDAAVVVMAYGLRSRSRNLASEKAAIKSYRAIFGRTPVSATAWDAVRAIAYSGAKR